MLWGYEQISEENDPQIVCFQIVHGAPKNLMIVSPTNLQQTMVIHDWDLEKCP